MQHYTLEMTLSVTGTVVVEAGSREEAISKAKGKVSLPLPISGLLFASADKDVSSIIHPDGREEEVD